jgi:cytoskeletal protein RodZ
MKDAYVVLGWLLVTGLVNAAMSRRTAEEWEAWAEKNPRYAAFAGFLRAVGLDPVKLIKSIVDILRGASQKHLDVASCVASSVDSTCAEPKDEQPVEEPAKAQDQADESPKPEAPAAEAAVAPAEEPVAAPQQPAAPKAFSNNVKRNKSAKRKGKR